MDTGDAVPMSIRDVRTSKKDRQWIQDVYGEYVEDLADLNTGFFSVVSAESTQQDEIFASWFSNEHAHPLVLVNGRESIGFALVTRPRIPAAGERSADFCMSEFFVRKAHRRLGLGRDAATLIFDRFFGDWEIVAYQRNAGSVAFWRTVIGHYSRGEFQERLRHGEIRQRFRSRRPSF
jgi:predicted acetyltransferase